MKVSNRTGLGTTDRFVKSGESVASVGTHKLAIPPKVISSPGLKSGIPSQPSNGFDRHRSRAGDPESRPISDVSLLYDDGSVGCDDCFANGKSFGNGPDDGSPDCDIRAQASLITGEIEKLMKALLRIRAYAGPNRMAYDDEVSQSEASNGHITNHYSINTTPDGVEDSLYEPFQIPSFVTFPHDHYVVQQGHVAEINFEIEAPCYAECTLSRQTHNQRDQSPLWIALAHESGTGGTDGGNLKTAFRRSAPPTSSLNRTLFSCYIFDSTPSDTGLYRVECSNIKGTTTTPPIMLEIIETENPLATGRPAFKKMADNADRDDGGSTNGHSFEVKLSMEPLLPIPVLYWFQDGMRVDHSSQPYLNDGPILLDLYPSAIELKSCQAPERRHNHIPTQSKSSPQDHHSSPDHPGIVTILSATMSIPRQSCGGDDMSPTRFSGSSYMCLAENEIGRAVSMFRLTTLPSSLGDGAPRTLRLVGDLGPSCKAMAWPLLAEPPASAKICLDSSDDFYDGFDIPPPAPGIKESVVTRLLVLADEPLEDLRVAFDSEPPPPVPKKGDVPFISYRGGATEDNTDGPTPVLVVHERFAQYPPHNGYEESNKEETGEFVYYDKLESPIPNSLDDTTNSTSATATATNTSNTEDDTSSDDTCSESAAKLSTTTTVAAPCSGALKRIPVKRNYYFYSSTRVDRLECTPRDASTDFENPKGRNDTCRESPDKSSPERIRAKSTIATTQIERTSHPLPAKQATPKHYAKAVTTPPPLAAQSFAVPSQGIETEDGIHLKKRDATNVIFMSCSPGTPNTKGGSDLSPDTIPHPHGGTTKGVTTPPPLTKFSKARSFFESRPDRGSNISNDGKAEDSGPGHNHAHSRAQHSSVMWRQPPLMPVSCSSTLGVTTMLEKIPEYVKPSYDTHPNNLIVSDSHRSSNRDNDRTSVGIGGSHTITPLTTCAVSEDARSLQNSSAQSHYSDPLTVIKLARIRLTNRAPASPWPRRRFTTEVGPNAAGLDRESRDGANGGERAQRCHVTHYSSSADISSGKS